MLGADIFGPVCVPDAARVVAEAKKEARSLGMGVIRVAGCSYDAEREIIPCDPEKMRAATERKLRELGLLGGQPLTMDVYIMARNIHSEGARGTPAEKLALGEALVNRALAEGRSMTSIALKNGTHFGRQKGCNPCVSTRQDPEWDDIVAAQMVLGGYTDNLARGATHYFSPRTMDYIHTQGGRHDRFSLYDDWTAGGDLMTWVGHVPGVDHTRQFFMVRMPKTTEGRAQHAAMRAPGRAALGQKTPSEILNASYCSGGSPVAGLFAVVGTGIVLASATAFYFIARYGRGFQRGAS